MHAQQIARAERLEHRVPFALRRLRSDERKLIGDNLHLEAACHMNRSARAQGPFSPRLSVDQVQIETEIVAEARVE